MKVTDVVKLALAGKTPGEISELYELEKKIKDDAPDIEPDPDPAPDPKDPDPAPADPEPGKDEKPEDKKEPEIDYKKMYEQAMKDLKAAQEANRKGAMNPDEDPAAKRQDLITNIVRDFM